MNPFEQKLASLSEQTIFVLEGFSTQEDYVALDLSKNNPELESLAITNPNTCESYIAKILEKAGGHVAYGGYLEHRNLYSDKSSFSMDGELQRDIHLGIDFWCKAGTNVVTPIHGTVHSFQNNKNEGDYGPTIILKHQVDGFIFHTLYGHLALSAINGLYLGKEFKRGSILGSLGTSDINVNYAPHLHFQIIEDIEGYFGDYPGVCAKNRLGHYTKNCPDPNFLLKLE